VGRARLDAFETGKRLTPRRDGRSLAGPGTASHRSPDLVAQFGLVAISIGAVVMMATLDGLNETGFRSAVLFGIGAGPWPQLGNVIMSSAIR
jgi:hypothetical protein